MSPFILRDFIKRPSAEVSATSRRQSDGSDSNLLNDRLTSAQDLPKMTYLLMMSQIAFLDNIENDYSKVSERVSSADSTVWITDGAPRSPKFLSSFSPESQGLVSRGSSGFYLDEYESHIPITYRCVDLMIIDGCLPFVSA